MATEPRTASGDGFRADLEGLRGVAILLVLGFHAGLPGTTGGFVGVDVFFVLSGFLITGILLRERERTGRIDLAAFYARRARRILPAAIVVLVAILAASWFLLAPLDLPRVAGDAVAAALSVGNIRFAASARDYFGVDATPSPILHYWSLGVEEQFYFVWPALLILATRSRRPRVAAGVVLGVLVVVSYLAAWWLTDAAPNWAFYSLPTRAWELGLGGLLAATTMRHESLPSWIAVPLGWLGLAAILAALVLILPSTPYPGVAALLPALGSAAVILSGQRRGSVATLLALRPLRFLGLISYSLYLVHWPILVLPAADLPVGELLPLGMRVGLALVAVAVGWVSYRFIERPIHRGRRFAARPPRTLAWAAVAIAIAVAVSGGLGYTAAANLNGGVAVASKAGQPTPSASTVGSPAGGSPSPGQGGESPAATNAASAGPTAIPSPPAGPQPLPAGVRPTLAQAPFDAETLEADLCLLGQPQLTPPSCVYGDFKGTRTVAVVGDSHASQWFPALIPIAQARGWRLVPFIKLSCRFIDMSLFSYWYQRTYTECATWRKTVVRRLQALKPDLVIVSFVRDRETSTASDPDPVHQGLAMAALLNQVPGSKAIIVDTPSSRYDVPSCISRHPSDLRPCATAKPTAVGAHPGVVEATGASASGAILVDLTPLICPWDSCPVVLNGMIIYRDSHHLTATFSASLANPLGEALAGALP